MGPGAAKKESLHRAGLVARRAPSQTLVEFALALPVFLLWLLVTLQFGLIVVQELGLIGVTQETARWLSARADTVDSAVQSHAQSNPLSLDPSRLTLVATSPACAALVGGMCDQRTSGGTLTVTMRYDVSSWVFLPVDFNLAGLQVTIPTSLPDYSVTVLVE